MPSTERNSRSYFLLSISGLLIYNVLINIKIHDGLIPIDDSLSYFNLIDSETDSETKTEADLLRHDDGIAKSPPPAALASIQCDRHGGANQTIADGLVYWYDIPSDASYLNPFQELHQTEEEEKYVIFKKDPAGWNNVRMALETFIVMGVSMGRTIVLPPEQNFYMLNNKKSKVQFTFDDFYYLNETQNEHLGIKIIYMTEFLEEVAMRGKMKHRKTSQPSFPPGNRTNWDKATGKEIKGLYEWIGKTSFVESNPWQPTECIAFWPETADAKKDEIESLFQVSSNVSLSLFASDPFPVNSSVKERLAEHKASRKSLCLYHKEMQEALVVYFDENSRLLTPFYAFHFYENWKQAIWTKRFVRDHLRYRDEIVCAAARVVAAIHEKIGERNLTTSDVSFSSMHIRRGDFRQQYKQQIKSAEDLYTSSKDMLSPNSTIFIATDEKNKTYFDPLKEHYDIWFLSDFTHLLDEVNHNMYGLVDQLVVANGEVFVGTFFSTFTAYVNRLRGYYSIRDEKPGYDRGELRSSFFFFPGYKTDVMTKYSPIKGPYWPNEYPLGWIDIDKDTS